MTTISYIISTLFFFPCAWRFLLHSFLGVKFQVPHLDSLQVPKLKVLMGSTYRADLDPGDEKDPRAEAGLFP